MSLRRVENSSENLLMSLFKHGVSNVQPRNILKKFIKVKKEVSVSQGDKYAKFSPFSGFKVSFCIEFDHPYFYKLHDSATYLLL